MPGDDLLPTASFSATRAVDIDAPPDRVWPWLVQVGRGRAGFYSYDVLDNGGRPSARRILPQFQDPGQGDLAAPMTAAPGRSTSFRVTVARAPSILVWSKPDSTWCWMLSPTAAHGTRLVTRLRTRYRLGPLLPLSLALMEIADFPMMRRMLLGIRERAESTTTPGP